MEIFAEGIWWRKCVYFLFSLDHNSSNHSTTHHKPPASSLWQIPWVQLGQRLFFSFLYNRHFIFINTHTLTSQDGELSWLQNSHECRYGKWQREDSGGKQHSALCLVLLNLIKAAEGADLLSGPIMLNPGKYTVLKHAASLDCATSNYVLLHHTKLWTDVMINRGKMLISIKKKDRMERVLCSNAEFCLLFFPPYTLHSVGCCPKAEDIFLSPMNGIFYPKSGKEASISIHMSS